ncbi:LysR family transcriptional regulator [Ramlibacter sp. MAHUQ-53]|uniref:LysR family transcriptional regulator n=1 Tax=unclassified Ramlibacter TaxID=2617605 RepID=UPI00363788FD
MNLRFVEAFHWAVALSSVTRAAEKLHITQSALSARIAALEDELGVVLLDRRERQFRLTIAGQRFHALAKPLLELQRKLKEEMGSDAQRPVALRIGAIESVVHTWLTGWLQQMRESHPDFALELTVETSPVLVDQVNRGVQDLVFCALPAVDGMVRTRALPSMPMAFIGHAQQHRRRHYTLQDLAQLGLITFQRGSQPHQSLMELFQRQGLPMPRVHAISSISAMAQLVEGGFGVATLPASSAARLAQRAPLRRLTVDVELNPLPLYASYREDPSSALTESVLASAVAYLESLPSAA